MPNFIILLLILWKQSQKSEGGSISAAAAMSDTAERDKLSHPLEPYWRMLSGMKLKKEGEDEDTRVGLDSKTGEGEKMEGAEGEEGDEEDRLSLPTPRKRLLNFKIPLVHGAGQRRDQQMSVVARRKLFRGGMW